MTSILLNGSGAATSADLVVTPGRRYVFTYALPDGAPAAAYTLTPVELDPVEGVSHPIQLTPGTSVAFAATSATGGRFEFVAALANFRFGVTSSAPNTGVEIHYALVPIA